VGRAGPKNRPIYAELLSEFAETETASRRGIATSAGRNVGAGWVQRAIFLGRL